MANTPPGKIRNPDTGRYVKIDGVIGKRVLAAAAAAAAAAAMAAVAIKSKTPSPPKSRSPPETSSVKRLILKELKDKCNNDSDPISLDDFDKLSIKQLNNLVLIGTKAKKNCYILENIYELYKSAIKSNKAPKDPMDPSHELTNAEINEINNKMKKIDPSYTPPVYVPYVPYPNGFTLNIELSPAYENYFTIKVMRNNRVIKDLGVVPGWVDTHHTGSADFTSGVLLANLQNIWESRKFLTDGICSPLIVNILSKSHNYFQSDWKRKFITLCEKIKEILDDDN
jgi:hypothetical protein